MEMLEEQRETWPSRGGFVLAAVGSAVGLGNLWGFPYKLYSYGGGAFLIPYITAMFCIGIPMLILEFSLGHFTQRAAPDAFARTGRKKEFVGWWGIILGFVIITYYPVILAYCVSFMGYSLAGIVNGGKLPWAGEGIEGVENAKIFFNETYLGKIDGPALGAIRMNLVLPLLVTWLAMYFCIFRGVKLVGKIVWLTVPLPALMLVVLAVRGLTLPGSMKGLVYFLDPVWSQLSKPSTWRFAFGQVFFSLSLAFGVMVTYASFLHRKSDINNNAAIIGLADFATSFIAGLAIFATLGGMAFVTAQAGTAVGVENVVDAGPGLAFVAFPYALAQLPGAPWWSFVFFFTLVTLGIDSAFSITESVLAGLVDKTGWRRCIVLPVMSLVGLAFGLFYITRGGLGWIGTIDGFINGTWGIAFLGLLECVVLGWLYRIDTLREHANERSDWKLGRWWNYSIRIFIPIVLGTLFFWSLFDDFGSGAGFFRAADGQWNIPNCVGMAVVAAAPILAVIMSLIKSPLRQDDIVNSRDQVIVKSRALGVLAFLISILATAISLTALDCVPINLGSYMILCAMGLAIVAIIISNFLMERASSKMVRPSVFASWAGIIATLTISMIIAVLLVRITQDTAAETVSTTAEKLSGTSYIILGVVFMLIVAGMSWCFYRAIGKVEQNTEHRIQESEDGM
jgi:neurotransmitter:Na+ symporter, NSS family